MGVFRTVLVSAEFEVVALCDEYSAQSAFNTLISEVNSIIFDANAKYGSANASSVDIQ